jgi:hypothetical protein
MAFPTVDVTLRATSQVIAQWIFIGYLSLANVSGLQPPEPKANGGWEGRIVRLVFSFVSSWPQKGCQDQKKCCRSDILWARSIKCLWLSPFALVRYDKGSNTENRRTQKQPKEDKADLADYWISRRDKSRTGEESNTEAEQCGSASTSFCEGHHLRIFALITNGHFLLPNVATHQRRGSAVRCRRWLDSFELRFRHHSISAIE